MGVPMYMQTATFEIKETAAGGCQTLTTTHNVKQGVVDGGAQNEFVDVSVRHAYRCCGLTGRYYGGIAITNGQYLGSNHELCSSTVNQCGLFADNMEMIGVSHVVSANTETGASPLDLDAYVVGQTLFPTAAPTRSPTAAGATYSPTPYPTAQPTRHPTMVSAATGSPTPNGGTAAPTNYPTPPPTPTLRL